MTVLNNQLRESLLKLSQEDRVSHAYLLEGEDTAAAFEIASAFGKSLVSSAADLLIPEHEKPNLISVEDVRTGINETVAIKPYGERHKVYIIRDAEKMNAAAQNAFLKTLEEPPEYVVFILIATHSEALLPTILSRVVRLSVFSSGAVGKDDEETAVLQEIVDRFLTALPEKTLQDALDFAAELNKHKTGAETALTLLRAAYRDILVLKAGGGEALLLRAEMAGPLRALSEKMSFRGITAAFSAMDEMASRLEYNVNFELSAESLALALRNEIQEVLW